MVDVKGTLYGTTLNGGAYGWGLLFRLDPKSRALVENFGGQWLAVREYDSVQPAAEYKDYDNLLKQAAKDEPYAFFGEVLTKNLSITSFLDSDFVMVNERLAKHYGITGVKGPEFRRVAIRPEHHRGGVLCRSAERLPCRQAAYPWTRANRLRGSIRVTPPVI